MISDGQEYETASRKPCCEVPCCHFCPIKHVISEGAASPSTMHLAHLWPLKVISLYLSLSLSLSLYIYIYIFHWDSNELSHIAKVEAEIFKIVYVCATVLILAGERDRAQVCVCEREKRCFPCLENVAAHLKLTFINVKFDRSG